MPDSPDAPTGPDFLDRLLARHTAPRPAAARVRPRLPGPFERVEAVRATAPATDEDALLWPATSPAAVSPAEGPRPAAAETRTHTERERTVVRTERDPERPAPRPAVPDRAEAPLLRPAAAVVPAPRPLPEGGRRAVARAERAPAPTAAAVPVPRVRTPLPTPCRRRCDPAPPTRRQPGTPYGRPRPGGPRGVPSRWSRCRSGGSK
ncbi:hypothetical protein ACQEWB_09690 [Streptomyces sp. CA-249302]|uniref:hypothetical protein n=1 Tax=Streptomyces sp. CA-249302 TaxID=3240058 RepID=UPI003D93482E